MKNSYRRLLSLTMALVLILSTAAVLSGCYVTKSAKMKFIEGTWELTSYSGDSNWLQERGMKLIMVIRSDGTGYYGYSDNQTAAFISELRCRFTQDDKDLGKYQFLEIDFTGDGEYHKLGINANWRTQKLNSSTPKWKGNLFEGTAEIDYYVNVGFTRISQTTDVSTLDSHFPGEHQTVVYGTQKYEGTYVFERCDGGIYPDIEGYIPPSPFVYFYLDIDFHHGTGRAYYMLTEDEIAKQVDVLVKVTKNNDNSFSVHIGDIVGDLFEKDFARYIHLPRVDTEYMEFRYVGDMTHESIVTHCENAYATYINNKLTTEILQYSGIYEFVGIIYHENNECLITTNQEYVYCYYDLNIPEGTVKIYGMSIEGEKCIEQAATLTYEYDINGNLIFLINGNPYFEVAMYDNRIILKESTYPEWDNIYAYCGKLTQEQLQQKINEKYQLYIDSKTEN